MQDARFWISVSCGWLNDFCEFKGLPFTPFFTFYDTYNVSDDTFLCFVMGEEVFVTDDGLFSFTMLVICGCFAKGNRASTFWTSSFHRTRSTRTLIVFIIFVPMTSPVMVIFLRAVDAMWPELEVVQGDTNCEFDSGFIKKISGCEWLGHDK